MNVYWYVCFLAIAGYALMYIVYIASDKLGDWCGRQSEERDRLSPDQEMQEEKEDDNHEDHDVWKKWYGWYCFFNNIHYALEGAFMPSTTISASIFAIYIILSRFFPPAW